VLFRPPFGFASRCVDSAFEFLDQLAALFDRQERAVISRVLSSGAYRTESHKMASGKSALLQVAD
jgi:hypothetical protein